MITPYNKCVLVKRDDPTIPPDIANHFKGGLIVIPEIAKAKSREARVLKVGPNVQENIHEGDRVLITWLDGTKYDDADLGIVEVLYDYEILAIVED